MLLLQESTFLAYYHADVLYVAEVCSRGHVGASPQRYEPVYSALKVAAHGEPRVRSEWQ